MRLFWECATPISALSGRSTRRRWPPGDARPQLRMDGGDADQGRPAGLREREIPVRYRKRIGRSKISGTIRGVFGAGTKILSTIFLSAIDWHFRSKHQLKSKLRSEETIKR